MDVLDLLAHGLKAEQILEEHPDLEPEDISACLQFASSHLNHPEIGRVQDEYLEVLYKIIKAPEHGGDADRPETWHDFIAETYGCLSDDPIARGDQGKYEIRGSIE